MHLRCSSPNDFPDVILFREDADQVMNVEFETVDSNFEKLEHDKSKCDLIVCVLKDKNWKNPITVLELKPELETSEVYPPSK